LLGSIDRADRLIAFFAIFFHTKAVDIVFLCSTASAALFLFFLFILIAPLASKSGRAAGKTRAWLALVFLEIELSMLVSIADAIGAPLALRTALSVSSNLYGLPALYLFAMASIGRFPAQARAHFIPAIASTAMGLSLLIAEVSAGLAWELLDFGIVLAALLQIPVYARLCYRALGKRQDPATRALDPRAKGLVLAMLGTYLLVFFWLVAGIALEGFAVSGVSEAQLKGTTALVDVLGYAGALAFAFVAGYFFVTVSGYESAKASAPEPEKEAKGGRKYARLPLDARALDWLAARAQAWLRSQKRLESEMVEPRTVAKALGVPYHHLSAACNECGGGIRAMINGERLDRAERLLESRPDLSVLDIALETGFSAKSSFNQAWARRHGTSPREWRSARRGPRPERR